MQEKHNSRSSARAGLARCLQPLAKKKKRYVLASFVDKPFTCFQGDQ